MGQGVIVDTTTACTVPTPGTSLSASGMTTVSTSNVSGGAIVAVTGPLNLPNQSLTGKCRFRLQNHKDVGTDVTVIGQNNCMNNPMAQPRHTACAASASSVNHQVLVVDIASIDGAAGTYQGSVTASAPGASTQICATGRCVLDFPTNAQVTVAATPAANASVASWEYDCTAELPSRVSSVMVGMDQARHCAIKFGPLASLTQLIGECPANYASQLYRLKLPGNEPRKCVTSIEAFEANMRAGVTTSIPKDGRAILGFPLFSVLQAPNAGLNARAQVRIGLDYRGRVTDYMTPVPAPAGTFVRPALPGPLQ